MAQTQNASASAADATSLAVGNGMTADTCQRCGKSLPGFALGLRGFGWRQRVHEKRCLRRANQQLQVQDAQADDVTALVAEDATAQHAEEDAVAQKTQEELAEKQAEEEVIAKRLDEEAAARKTDEQTAAALSKAQEDAAAKVIEETATASAPIEQRPTDCKWMFDDAATGWLGINAFAHLNPLRWSGPITFEKAIQDLEAVRAHKDRPIVVKAPANTSQQNRFETIQQGLDFIRGLQVITAVVASGEEQHDAEVDAGQLRAPSPKKEIDDKIADQRPRLGEFSPAGC